MAESTHTAGLTVGAELLDIIVRFNRWATYHAEWPLPPVQARLLAQINSLGEVRIGDLASAERCSQPTMTVQVQRLLDHGLVSRAADPADGRATLISLTAEGRRLMIEVRRARAATISPLIDRLSAADQQRLREALVTLTDLLHAAYADSSTLEEQPKQ